MSKISDFEDEAPDELLRALGLLVLETSVLESTMQFLIAELAERSSREPAKGSSRPSRTESICWTAGPPAWSSRRGFRARRTILLKLAREQFGEGIQTTELSGLLGRIKKEIVTVRNDLIHELWTKGCAGALQIVITKTAENSDLGTSERDRPVPHFKTQPRSADEIKELVHKTFQARHDLHAWRFKHLRIPAARR